MNINKIVLLVQMVVVYGQKINVINILNVKIFYLQLMKNVNKYQNIVQQMVFNVFH